METQRARVKNFLHHIRMAHSALPWVLRITWILSLIQQRLHLARCFPIRKPLSRLGLVHWWSLLRLAIRNERNSLATLNLGRKDNSQIQWKKLKIEKFYFITFPCYIRILYDSPLMAGKPIYLVYEEGKYPVHYFLCLPFPSFLFNIFWTWMYSLDRNNWLPCIFSPYRKMESWLGLCQTFLIESFHLSVYVNSFCTMKYTKSKYMEN